ncbi:vesicle-associated membrane protein 1 isoform X3 [Zootoca vivipara]|uniref:vesicle-associated membrane protein 1 isoform X3 n=1 Tax=Zootoca vivipara TaxID=8524 RepID=UPI00293BC210|nr:vesicle-associated membrane protein 1 isoform X3 [Zootoca vivipara]
MSDPAQQPGTGQEGEENAGGPPGAPPNLTSNRRLQQTQAQVEEVVDIMRVNVDKVLERDQKLSELDERADALQAGAQVFESSAAALKRKYWWKNCKMMIMLGVICAIVVIAIAPCCEGADSVCMLTATHQHFICRAHLLDLPPPSSTSGGCLEENRNTEALRWFGQTSPVSAELGWRSATHLKRIRGPFCFVMLLSLWGGNTVRCLKSPLDLFWTRSWF